MLILGACAPEALDNESGLTMATPVATTDAPALCAEVDRMWGEDWTLVIDNLRTLRHMDRVCPEATQSSGERLYAAYLTYGAQLEAAGDRRSAGVQYAAALGLNIVDTSAAKARLAALYIAPTATSDCNAQQVTLPDYVPVIMDDYVALTNNALTLNNVPYPIYGINYYPRDFPEDRFLTESDLDTVALELDLIAGADFNTLRIFLRHDQLFACDDIPIADAFARLDGVIQAAGHRGLRVIAALHHDTTRPTFTGADVSRAQTRFIVRRYASEGAILAYDLRDQGDTDYANDESLKISVLNWLSNTAEVIREYAPDHLITAGWDDDSAVTAPIVDFVSFQNYGQLDDLRQEIAIVTGGTQKPIVLIAFGYDTLTYDEIGQRQAYQRALEAVNANGLAGWVAWTAFDHPLTTLCKEPKCPAEVSPAHRFGLWSTGYFPYLALDAILAVTSPE